MCALTWGIIDYPLFCIVLESSVLELLLSSRAPTSEEIRLSKESSSLEALDNDLGEIHSKILPGSVLLFEVPNQSLMNGKSIVLGNQRCIFFNREVDAADLVRVIREIVLGKKLSGI